MRIVKADPSDLPTILALQKLAYRSEAALLGTDDIPPLKQTLEEVAEEFATGIILKGLLGQKIVGSVRAWSDGHTCHVGKLMVSPEHQRQGYGSRLLAAIETAWPHQRYELFTSDRSIANIRLYEKTGYRFFREKLIRPGLRFVYMEKVLKHA